MMRLKGFFLLRHFVNAAILWLFMARLTGGGKFHVNDIIPEYLETALERKSEGFSLQDNGLNREATGIVNSHPLGEQLNAESRKMQLDRYKLENDFWRLRSQLRTILEQEQYTSEEKVQSIGQDLLDVFSRLDPSGQTSLLGSVVSNQHQVPTASSPAQEGSHTSQSSILHSEKSPWTSPRTTPGSEKRVVEANLAAENSQSDTANQFDKTWGATLKDLWSIIIRGNALAEPQGSRGAEIRLGCGNQSDLGKLKSLKIVDKVVFERKEWFRLIGGEHATLSEPAPMAITGAAVSVAWGLLDYVVGNKIYDQRAIEQIILKGNEYEAMLQDFIIEQMVASPTLDPFFDRQDFKLFVREHPNLRHISKLVKGMSLESWQTLEMDYLKLYLNFYEDFPFHSNSAAIDIPLKLRKLIADIEAGKEIDTSNWLELSFELTSKHLSVPHSLDTYMAYHIYLYQAFKYCQNYFPNLVSSDKNLVNRMEWFGKGFKATQAMIHFWKTFMHPEIVLNYLLKDGLFNSLLFFQKKIVPRLFKKFRKATDSRFDYVFSQESPEILKKEGHMTSLWARTSRLRLSQSPEAWLANVHASYERVKSEYAEFEETEIEMLKLVKSAELNKDQAPLEDWWQVPFMSLLGERLKMVQAIIWMKYHGLCIEIEEII